jgi:hypothetical protein
MVAEQEQQRAEAKHQEAMRELEVKFSDLKIACGTDVSRVEFCLDMLDKRKQGLVGLPTPARAYEDAKNPVIDPTYCKLGPVPERFWKPAIHLIRADLTSRGKHCAFTDDLQLIDKIESSGRGKIKKLLFTVCNVDNKTPLASCLHDPDLFARSLCMRAKQVGGKLSVAEFDENGNASYESIKCFVLLPVCPANLIDRETHRYTSVKHISGLETDLWTSLVVTAEWTQNDFESESKATCATRDAKPTVKKLIELFE